MIVTSKREQLQFPPMCPCCGESATENAKLSDYAFSGGRMTIRTWDVPHCKLCIEHQKRHGAAGSRMGLRMRGWEQALALVTLGLYFLFWKLVVYPKLEAARARDEVEGKAAAQAMCKPSCGAVTGLVYKFDRNAAAHTFDAPSDAWRERFSAANGSAAAAGYGGILLVT